VSAYRQPDPPPAEPPVHVAAKKPVERLIVPCEDEDGASEGPLVRDVEERESYFVGDLRLQTNGSPIATLVYVALIIAITIVFVFGLSPVGH
jgi:hypothetical protein